MMTSDPHTKSDRSYSVVVRWSEIDNAYLADFSDFPGVHGYGETREAAIKQAEDALKLALAAHTKRHWEPPKPDASLGASGQFRLRLPRQLHARLSIAATQNGVSLNQFVVSLIADGLARAEQVPKNAIAGLQAWFEVALQKGLSKALSRSRGEVDVPDASNLPYSQVEMALKKPFQSRSKWAPMTSKTAKEIDALAREVAARGSDYFEVVKKARQNPLIRPVSKRSSSSEG